MDKTASKDVQQVDQETAPDQTETSINSLFNISDQFFSTGNTLSAKSSLFSINPETYDKLLMGGNSAARTSQNIVAQGLTLPGDQEVDLVLTPISILGEDFRFLAGKPDGDEEVSIDPGLHFRGHVKGQSESSVFVSVFRDFAVGHINMQSKDKRSTERYDITPLAIRKNVTTQMRMLKHDPEDLEYISAEHFCKTDQVEDYQARVAELMAKTVKQHKSSPDELQNSRMLLLKIAVDCDFEYYTRHGSDLTRAAQYAISLFAAVSDIYERELHCRIELPFLRVWTATDPYPGTDALIIRNNFANHWRNNMTGVERSMAYLLSGKRTPTLQGIGGVAFLDALCDNNRSYGVTGSNNNTVFPFSGTYTWDINNVAHETGHVIGTPHTHDCSWNPEIDRCSQASGACFSGPIIPQVGTIMSYCTQAPGGSKELRFHPNVLTLMRERIESATCLYELRGELADDVKTTQIILPSNGGEIAASAAFSPESLFENIGTNTQTIMSVHFEIHDANNILQHSLTESVGPLNPDDVERKVFNSVSLATPGTYQAKSWIVLAGDQDPINNTVSRTFEVVPAVSGSVTLTAPTVFNSYSAGNLLNITWNATGIADVRIEWTPDDGLSWYDIISRTPAASGTFTWTIPAIRATHGRVRISDFTNSSTFDESSSVFHVGFGNELEAYEILLPEPGSQIGSPIAPLALIRNNGTMQQNNVDVNLRIVDRVREVEVYNETRTIAYIAAGETFRLGFAEAIAFRKANHNVFLEVINPGDDRPGNNLLFRSFDFSQLNNVIATGMDHSLALQTNNGTVWAWGDNFQGQLGDGSGVDEALPRRVLGLNDVASVAAGYWHNLALLENGTVISWGSNPFGQLGIGLFGNIYPPQPVNGLVNVNAIACGREHSLALLNNGTVLAWGRNTFGELGDGSQTHRAIPFPVPGLQNIVAIAAGEFFSMALNEDGIIYTWGRNNSGELGNGTFAMSTSPVIVSGGFTADAIDAGAMHALAILDDGRVISWGSNGSGQLGNGGQGNSNVPVFATGINNARKVAAGRSHSHAILLDGSVLSWGSAANGRLGNGVTTGVFSTPQFVAVPQARDICVSADHTLLVNADGGICFVGRNTNGQLGDGTLADKSTFTCGMALAIASSERPISGGVNHSLALKVDDGTVWAWGHNSSGQLGNGSWANSVTPVQTNGLVDITSVATGAFNSLALRSDGTIFSWGNGVFGQHGNGATVHLNTPFPVAGISNAIGIAAGMYHCAAVLEDGNVRTWGYGGFGNLGNGGTATQYTPVNVTISDVVAVAAGQYHTLALRSDGTIQAWGRNNNGQLGDGSVQQRNAPVTVLGINNAIAIAAGANHSMALLADGTVRTWGLNSFGQLGNGTQLASTIPVTAQGLTDIVGIAGGSSHSYALDVDGNVFAFGNNLYGQLGDGTLMLRTIPIQVGTLSGVTKLAETWHHSLVYKAGGTVCGVGFNTWGQIGDGSQLSTSIYSCQADSYLKPGLANDFGSSDADANVRTSGQGSVWIYPNPNSGVFNIECELAQPATLDVHITDLLGRELLHLTQSFGSGTAHINVQQEQLQSGTYLVQVNNQGNSLGVFPLVIHK